jgi:radical SAM-linked protein
MSEGFHPKPIISSPLSLALGIVGWEELLEVELTHSMDEDEFLVRVQPELDVGMEIVSCQQCARNDKAKVVAVEYRIPLLDVSEEEVRQRAKRVLSDADVIVERKLPGQPPKHIKARPFLLDIRVAEGAVRFRVRAGGQGGLRAEEVLQLLNLRSLIDRGAILERTHVELAAAGVGDAALGN